MDINGGDDGSRFVQTLFYSEKLSLEKISQINDIALRRFCSNIKEIRIIEVRIGEIVLYLTSHEIK